MSTHENKIKEVDSLEVISLVDNSADFLSAVDGKETLAFRQWTKKQYGEEWARTHPDGLLLNMAFQSSLGCTVMEKKSAFYLILALARMGLSKMLNGWA